MICIKCNTNPLFNFVLHPTQLSETKQQQKATQITKKKETKVVFTQNRNFQLHQKLLELSLAIENWLFIHIYIQRHTHI